MFLEAFSWASDSKKYFSLKEESYLFIYFLLFHKIDAALEEGVDALKQVLSKGLTETARCFNTEQKYKHIRLQTMPT